MSNNSNIRVRFAPAPTGTMHLGNIRTALINFLFAKQKKGTFVLRIEDTDTQRNFDPNAHKIIEHLNRLGLDYDEGPHKGGLYAPYFQSERTFIYQKNLDYLYHQGSIYRCFCTPQELEKKRERQITLKIAPRYDRACLSLTTAQLEEHFAQKKPFIWRVKLDHQKTITITDLARGPVSLELKNFSDFPITRADNTFTFIFANFVDDMLMHITHVFRGEDHLSNTASQAALYELFNVPLPVYYHLPILCNIKGQKLSKRDFGFSITDLQKGGFLPEAIANYLTTLGGSFKQEIISFADLPQHISFEKLHAGGQIKYDEDKLKWFNHQFILMTDIHTLTQLCKPFLSPVFPSVITVAEQQLVELIQLVKAEMYTLCDALPLLAFFFNKPTFTKEIMLSMIPADSIDKITKHIPTIITLLDDKDALIIYAKTIAQKDSITLKELFHYLRFALTGSTTGLGIKELIHILGKQETHNRLLYAYNIMN